MPIVVEKLNYAYMQGSAITKAALTDISLRIEDGEFLGLIGHTGSGKSTFVQQLNGLLQPNSGTVHVDGFDMADKKQRMEGRKLVGMVFQYPEYQLFAETVYEDVAFGIRNFLAEKDEKKVEDLVKSALEKVGLNYAEIKDKSPFALSGGQKRRVAIAGVIVVEPQVLVLDEPCAGLDPVGKKELWELLHYLHRTTAKTIIVVSHDMNDVADQCTKAAMFSDGKIIASGTPKELFSDRELIEKAGLDVPVTAYLKDELSPCLDDLDTDFKIADFAEKLAKKLNSKGQPKTKNKPITGL